MPIRKRIHPKKRKPITPLKNQEAADVLTKASKAISKELPNCSVCIHVFNGEEGISHLATIDYNALNEHLKSFIDIRIAAGSHS